MGSIWTLGGIETAITALQRGADVQRDVYVGPKTNPTWAKTTGRFQKKS